MEELNNMLHVRHLLNSCCHVSAVPCPFVSNCWYVSNCIPLFHTRILLLPFINCLVSLDALDCLDSLDSLDTFLIFPNFLKS